MNEIESRSKNRQKMYESEHNSNNEFVKRHQAMTASMGGKPPKLEAKYMKMDAEMVNDGPHADAFGRKLGSALDQKAFPVK